MPMRFTTTYFANLNTESLVMKKIRVLDCTLRDGGYCNEWKFGFENAARITNSLVEANVDIIECGFLTNRVTYHPNMTKFATVEQISKIIPSDRKGKLFVAMVNYGEYNAEDLPVCDGSSIDGIRVAFHKKHLAQALDFCKGVQNKGYKVFIQAMVSLNYTDEEFRGLIRSVNAFAPYAFYIVDSFGSMKRADLLRLFQIVELELNEGILVGFHSHNNMQLAYSNAQSLIDMPTGRDMIIDASVYGMGRGAGNLNTELIVDYLNENVGTGYALKPLLNIIDEILNDFYLRNKWGFSLPNYLSAAHNIHPNYASYLDDKKTLTVNDMNEIFERMDEDKKVSFQKAYIEELYLSYMEMGGTQGDHQVGLNEKLVGKKLLLVAPGKSSVEERKSITNFASADDVVTVSVNFDYQGCDVDYIFLSNLRRFRELSEDKYYKCIVTSNIPAREALLQVKYHDLLESEEAVADNAGLMAIKFFMNCGVKDIYLAGFDGYSHAVDENYGNSQMAYVTRDTVLDAINLGMSRVLGKYSEKANIYFLTKPKYVTAG